MKIRFLAAAAAALAVPALVLAQGAQLPTKEPAKPAAAAAAKEGPVATVNGAAIPRQYLDLLLRERIQQGAPDNEPLHQAVRNELINREIIVQEANRSGLTKRAELRTQIEIVRQNVIVQAYLRDYMSKHPVTDAEVQTEYERAKAQTGTTEYKARHILVDSEEEAKRLIAEVKKGAKFEELAQKHSKDSTKEKGGDLDWNIPGVYDKTFADAMVKLEKGKVTEVPVRTRFGFHIIQLDDVRPVKIPPLADVKPQIQQRLTQIKIDKLVGDLRAKAKVE
ncbi:MAG: peptidylprolyl isomerase [Betaproteobacteria bacterium]|nr:peptidylprolyl isomerase [Betaproteobacteria bacterium]